MPTFRQPTQTVSSLSKLITALLVLVLTCNLSACSSTTPVKKAEANPSSTTQQKTKTTLPNPHELTGVSTVAELSDPQPIKGDFTPKLPAQVTDIEGTSVTVKDTSRILALDLYGTLSRTVIALGLGKNIVGRSTSSTESELAQLPVVTQNGHALNSEAVLALKPTVIVADHSIGPPESFQQIRSAGVPVVFVSQDRSLETNSQLIQSVADALGMQQAGQALAKRTQEEIDKAKAQIKEWIPANPMKLAFLYVRGTGGVFFILGKEYGVSALIQAIGGEDVAAEKGITSMTPANAESLVALNPEAYLMMTKGIESAGGIEAVLKRPGVSNTIAGKKPRVIAIPDGIALSFGPQTAEIMLLVAKALYGVQN